MDQGSELEKAFGALSLGDTTVRYSLLMNAAVDTECMKDRVDANKLNSLITTRGGRLKVYKLPDGTTQARTLLSATVLVNSQVSGIETVNNQATRVGFLRSKSQSLLFLSAKLDDLETQLPDSVTPGSTLAFRNLQPVNIDPDSSVQQRVLGQYTESGDSVPHALGVFTTEVQHMQQPNGGSIFSERPVRLGWVEGDLFIGDSCEMLKSVSAEVMVAWTTLPWSGESDEVSNEA